MTEASPTNLVAYACSNQVATLTLNRPDRLNAFSDDLVRHLADAAAPFRSRPGGAGRDHLRQGPRLFQRRRRASAPIAQARGI